MNRLTMVEIIEETAKFYGDDVDRRGLLDQGDMDSGCVYASPDGDQHCAVGRCLTDEALAEGPDGHTDSNVTGVWHDIESLDRSLKEQYRGHTMRFWERLQHFHDCRHFWDDEGLSLMGDAEVKALIQLFI